MIEFLPPNFDLALLVLRLALGIVFLAHGPMKFTQTKKLAAGLQLSELQVKGIGVLEIIGIITLLSGFWVQVGAFCLMVVMLGAIYFKSQKWGKAFSGEGGWEFEFILLAAAFTVLLAGAGSYRLF